MDGGRRAGGGGDGLPGDFARDPAFVRGHGGAVIQPVPQQERADQQHRPAQRLRPARQADQRGDQAASPVSVYSTPSRPTRNVRLTSSALKPVSTMPTIPSAASPR